MIEKQTTPTHHEDPKIPKQGEPVTPTRRDMERDMDPTKRQPDMPKDEDAPDKDKPTGATPAR